MDRSVSSDVLFRRESADGRRILDLSFVTVASLLAGAVNPMGFMLYRYVLHHLGTPLMMQQILEWKPPTWENALVFLCLCVFRLGGDAFFRRPA